MAVFSLSFRYFVDNILQTKAEKEVVSEVFGAKHKASIGRLEFVD